MAWRDGCTVQILQHGRFFIAASVLTAGSNDPYGVLGVYLSSNDQHRMAQFTELTSVTQQFDGKVVLMGDFNAISNQLEKEGGGAKSPSSIETFNSFIDDNFLIDIGMVGRPFTWSNRRRGDELIQERLDRFLVGVDWQQLYPNATVLRLLESGSDHAPLLLDSNPRTERSKHRFKFQERWYSNDEIRQIIREVWHEQVDGSAMYILAKKIKRCRHKIVKWQQEHRSNSKVEIDLLQSKLEELRLAGIHGGDIISEIEDKLEKALQNEESYWKDKFRVKWLKSVATSNAGIASVAESYFKDIFSSTCHENPEPLFTDFEPKVTAQMKRRLQRPVTMEKVKRATFSIHPQSAPGDDEGLSFLLHKAEQNRLIQGLQIHRRCPKVNHLLFADDSILFCKASPEACSNILHLLNSYESISGQRDKYLGLPSTVSKSKKASFSMIKEKVRKRIQGLKRNLLSSGGRHILLKAVGEAIPIYTLSCFKLPDGLISEIHSLLSQFWWGQKGSERRMAWISWDTMTRPRKEGGLGFKDLRIQNLALLEIGVLPSWGWRSILEGRKIVQKGLNWAVGTSEDIRTFEDSWLPPPYPLMISDMPNRQAISELFPRVKDLITEDRNWNQNLIQELFSQDVANMILPVKIQQSRDKLQ
ncbi:uncharacterized protein LOC127740503 [Arachis duranensis]|uniref:Uncharacterized protein LOC127740503 n=1 Tax=Arachis duranensis TaxID=130453 RepID=A0A9C6WA31_ARADU|nr:uncharacterized protein LOC127740503 [Arachis duranensis]